VTLCRWIGSSWSFQWTILPPSSGSICMPLKVRVFWSFTTLRTTIWWLTTTQKTWIFNNTSIGTSNIACIIFIICSWQHAAMVTICTSEMHQVTKLQMQPALSLAHLTYMKKLRWQVTRANVTLSAEWAYCNGVFIQHWQVITKSTIHVPYSVKLGR